MEDEVCTSTAEPIAEHNRPLASVSDHDLLRRLTEILGQSRRVEKDLVAHIAEVDERRLYARQAFSSMFVYCTDGLHLSEGEAYRRIVVARASREHPVLLDMLGDGRLHLSGIALLAPHLTGENRDTLLRRATHRSKRQIEELIAEIAPRPDVTASIRKLPERAPSPAPSTCSGMGNSVTPSPGCGVGVRPSQPLPSLAPEQAPVSTPPRASEIVQRPVVEALAPGRYRVQFTASAALREKLERLQTLMLSQVPDGDLAAVIEAAVTEKLERIEARRLALTNRPRKGLADTDTTPASRHIPAPVRRAVRKRDGNQCRFVDSSGRRCGERRHLRYHHIHPYGMGGDHGFENIKLMCRRHDEYLAECDYGRRAMARFRREGKRGVDTAAVLIETMVVPARSDS
jgi:hypothetical protein